MYSYPTHKGDFRYMVDRAGNVNCLLHQKEKKERFRRTDLIKTKI
jgi:hypothetical protein